MRNLGRYMKSKMYLLLAVITAFVGGLLIPRPAQVSYITREVGIPVIEEKIIKAPVYIDRAFIREVEKPVYRDRFMDPREFPDLETLQVWYAKNRFTFVAVPGADCDDEARVLQLLAFRDGWILDKQLVRAGYLWDIYLGVDNHMGNIAVIENDIYYVEPGSKPMIKFITKKD